MSPSAEVSAFDRLTRMGWALGFQYVPVEIRTKEMLKAWRVSVMDRGFGGGPSCFGDTIEDACAAMLDGFLQTAREDALTAEAKATAARIHLESIEKEFGKGAP